jgi:hypothetical protein
MMNDGQQLSDNNRNDALGVISLIWDEKISLSLRKISWTFSLNKVVVLYICFVLLVRIAGSLSLSVTKCIQTGKMHSPPSHHCTGKVK